MQSSSRQNTKTLKKFLTLFLGRSVDIKNEFLQAEDLSTNGLCRKDELYFKNSCYYWSKDDDLLLSQERAREDCQSRNAELSSISTLYENSFIAKETSAVQG